MKIIIAAFILSLAVSGSAYAQRDQMKMGEAFGTKVIKKGQMEKKAVSSEKKPEPMKTQEALEIGVKRKSK